MNEADKQAVIKIRNFANATVMSIHEIDPYEGIQLSERNFQKIVTMADQLLEGSNERASTNRS